jgi:hypothetical protein
MYFGPTPPTDLLLSVARAAIMLGACHHHRRAGTVLPETVRRYRSDGDGSGAAEREQRWQDANRGHVLRRERHRAGLAAAPAVGGIVLPPSGGQQ